MQLQPRGLAQTTGKKSNESNDRKSTKCISPWAVVTEPMPFRWCRSWDRISRSEPWSGIASFDLVHNCNALQPWQCDRCTCLCTCRGSNGGVVTRQHASPPTCLRACVSPLIFAWRDVSGGARCEMVREREVLSAKKTLQCDYLNLTPYGVTLVSGLAFVSPLCVGARSHVTTPTRSASSIDGCAEGVRALRVHVRTHAQTHKYVHEVQMCVRACTLCMCVYVCHLTRANNTNQLVPALTSQARTPWTHQSGAAVHLISMRHGLYICYQCRIGLLHVNSPGKGRWRLILPIGFRGIELTTPPTISLASEYKSSSHVNQPRTVCTTAFFERLLPTGWHSACLFDVL